MFGLATLKAKLIAGLVLVALCAGAYFYVHNLNSRIDDLQIANTTITIERDLAREELKEIQRRKDIMDSFTKALTKLEKTHNDEYNKTLNKINRNVKEGKDTPVGPVLSDFFSGLRDNTHNNN